MENGRVQSFNGSQMALAQGNLSKLMSHFQQLGLPVPALGKPHPQAVHPVPTGTSHWDSLGGSFSPVGASLHP